MDSLLAFTKGAANRGKEMMVFDWHKAAELIRDTGAKSASAGLRGDWDYTGGAILENGKPVASQDTYTYLASTWATPELELDDGARMPCYRMQSECPDWGAATYWPDTALAIVKATFSG